MCDNLQCREEYEQLPQYEEDSQGQPGSLRLFHTELCHRRTHQPIERRQRSVYKNTVITSENNDLIDITFSL